MTQAITNYNDIKYYKMSSFRLGKLREIQEYLTEQGHNYDTMIWLLQEKLHGSNSCFIHRYIDGEKDIKLGRRNGLVPENELKSFFNIGEAYQEYMPSLADLAETVCYERGLDSRNHRVIVYCELYGNKIQKGMKYNDVETIAVFDIRIDNTFLSYQDVESMCSRHGIPLAPLVMKGTLDELVEKFRDQLEDMNSLVPRVLHGQDIMDAPAEGVIVRPYNLEETYDPDDEDFKMLRYKWKKMEFSERPKPKQVTAGEVSHLQALLEEAINYINIQRLETFKSKVGVEFLMNKRNMGKNIGALVKDTLIDIREESKFVPLLEDKKHFAELRKMISKTSSQLIQNFQFEYIEPEPKVLTDEEYLAKIDQHIAESRRNIDQIRAQIQELQCRTPML